MQMWYHQYMVNYSKSLLNWRIYKTPYDIVSSYEIITVIIITFKKSVPLFI